MDDSYQNQALVKLLTLLKNEGATMEEAMQVVQQINDLASSQLYAMILEVMTEKEVADLNQQAKHQDEANQLIAHLFKQRTGKDAEVEKEQMISVLAESYLEDYLKRKSESLTS